MVFCKVGVAFELRRAPTFVSARGGRYLEMSAVDSNQQQSSATDHLQQIRLQEEACNVLKEKVNQKFLLIRNKIATFPICTHKCSSRKQENVHPKVYSQ